MGNCFQFIRLLKHGMFDIMKKRVSARISQKANCSKIGTED